MTNVTWRVPLRRGFTLSSSLKNLFDRTYADPGSEEHRQDAIVQHIGFFGELTMNNPLFMAKLYDSVP